MTNATPRGKPDAGNPHVRFEEREVASENPRRGSLLYNIRNIICAMAAIGLAEGAVCAEYTVVSEWNSVSSAGYADGITDLTAARGWTCPAAGAGVSNGVIVVDIEPFANGLVYTPTAPIATNKLATVYVAFTNVEARDISDLDNTTQAGLAAAIDDNATNWYGWCNVGWRKFTNVTPGMGPCIVRIELNNSNDTKLVRYAVEQGAAEVFTVLKAGETEWLTNGVAGAQRINKVSFDGVAAFTNITFTQTGTMTVADDSKFATRKTAQGIADADLNKVANNGNANWENLVLGLDGTQATSTPVVQPVQSTETDRVTLKLGGVDVDAASATVTYTVVESATPSGAGTETAAANYDTPTSVALPPSGVKYYRMKVQTVATESKK